MCMYQFYFSAVAFVLVLPVAAAPTPTDELTIKELKFPTKKGTTWVYKNTSFEVVHLLNRVEKKDGGVVLTIESEEKGARLAPVERLHLSDKGLFKVESLGKKLDEPRCLLKLPHKVGQKWDSS